jgi:hypothetical protein
VAQPLFDGSGDSSSAEAAGNELPKLPVFYGHVTMEVEAFKHNELQPVEKIQVRTANAALSVSLFRL